MTVNALLVASNQSQQRRYYVVPPPLRGGDIYGRQVEAIVYTGGTIFEDRDAV